MSDTPRTNQFLHGYEGVSKSRAYDKLAAYAKGLERELAEANEAFNAQVAAWYEVKQQSEKWESLARACKCARHEADNNVLAFNLQEVTTQRDRLAEALEAADECLALIEDVGHGAMSDNVTAARRIVLQALSDPQ